MSSVMKERHSHDHDHPHGHDHDHEHHHDSGAEGSRPEPEYWQSMDELLDTPEFREVLHREFPEDASEWLDPVSRRKFLGLMGASAALAGVVGCNPSLKPASNRKLIPYVKQPEQVVPGVPLYFTTAIPQNGGVGLGLLVKSVEGRPIKIEGNPSHPGSLGGTDLYSQASILDLYDPERSRRVVGPNKASATLEKAIAALQDELAKQKDKQGEGVRIVTETVTSPTFAALVKEFLKRHPKAKWIQYEAIGRDNPRRAGLEAFGKYVNPVYRFDKAKVVLALDSDFLASGPGSPRYARDFMAGRKLRQLEAAIKAGDGVAPENLKRLYAVESFVSSTGAVADHRLPLKPSEVEQFALALAKELGVSGIPDAKLNDFAAKWIKPLADDLRATAKEALVVVGDHQSPAVHLLAHAINEKIGAFNSTVVFTEPIEAEPTHQTADFRKLADDLKANTVDVLLMVGVNPVFTAPDDLQFGKLLKEMKGVSFHLGYHEDETAFESKWHINAAHYLESWGDVRAYDGTVTVQQPLIAPVFGGKSPVELFAQLLDLGVSDSLEVVKATWKKFFDEKLKGSGEFDTWWQRSLREGFLAGTAAAPVGVAAVKLDALNNKDFASPAVQGTEIQFRADPTLYDGRYANNGWLQETPKPITKLTWDNAAIVSPATAEKWGCTSSFRWTGGENGNTESDVVEIKVGDRKLKVALFILPGHADDCVTLHVGYGRDRSGTVGGKVDTKTKTGFNSYVLRTASTLWLASGVTATRTGERYSLACTQGQYAMEGRRPVRHATRDQLKADPDFAQVPAVSAGEYKDLQALTPGTPEDFARLGLPHPHAPHAHGHDHDEKHGESHKGHDGRMIPLNLYPTNPLQVNGQDTSKTYRRWGMSIDLGACTGCSACVVACVSENNIPVVGKEQVNGGRAMHWIRIDRYFSIPNDALFADELGDKSIGPKERSEKVKQSSAIRTHFQPVQCQQCEKAPCEVVCPVGATNHSADGLNDMAYNRCVGTRYCSNNCPYKVRRFNFLQYASFKDETLKLVNNPEVTLRTRGVMEKCTYCVQRIRAAEIEAEREFATRPQVNNRPHIRDGEIVTACQAACPTGAIVFGDINDPASAVLRAKAEATTYGLLAEVNTMPRTSYLAAVRNPNPAMPKGA